MKKFINRPEDVVEEMLEGFAVLHPDSVRLERYKVMMRADAETARQRQVAVISGGGSGHEPAHAGYVGDGMLTAAVAGEIFTSPSSEAVFAAIKAVAGSAGALLVVKNYTGDRLNFGVAAEMARSEGIPVEMLIVDDDVALRGAGHAAGARGLAGTVLIHKLMGAAAAEGLSLHELVLVGRSAVESLATMGVSLSAGTSPAVGRPSFVLGEEEMELGLGIHGEPGVTRERLPAADELTERLLTEIIKVARFGTGRRVAVLVNNLGATTEMELAIVARQAMRVLTRHRFTVERMYAGTFLSSLDMAGISISMLGVSDEWMRWLDAPTGAPAWPNVPKRRPGLLEARTVAEVSRVERPRRLQGTETAGRPIWAACDALIKAEPELTELDRVTGDGDLGVNMARAARVVWEEIASYPLDDVAALLKALGNTLARELGGSSGPLYGVLFLRCGNVLKQSHALGREEWVEALDRGSDAIGELGGANQGDRTMLDALRPFVDALRSGTGVEMSHETLLAASDAADRGAEATAQMRPRLGRSSYLGDRVLGHVDPGARAVAIWLRAVVEAIVGA